MERKDAKVEKEEAEKYRGLQLEIVSIEWRILIKRTILFYYVKYARKVS